MTLAPGTTVIDDPLAAARRVAALVTGADSPDSEIPTASRRERVANAVTELKRSGLLAATVPTRLGGPQLWPSQIAEVIRILATADGSLAQIPQSHLVFSRWFFDSEHPDLEADWAEVLLSGALIANAQAEREPVLFSQDGVQNAVEGTKIFCTGSPFADIIGVTGRSSGETSQTLATFLPADAIGVSVSDDWDALGQRFTGSGRVTFRGVTLPQHDKFGRLYHLDHALTLPGYGAFAQLLHIAVDVGIADGALTTGLSLANGSDPDPLTAHLAGELTALAYVGDAVLEKAARALDALWADPVADAQRRAQAASEVAAAKVTTGRTTVELASRIYELTGTRGIAEYGDEGLDRHWRDLRTHVLHERRRTKLHTLGRAALTGEDPQLGTQY